MSTILQFVFGQSALTKNVLLYCKLEGGTKKDYNVK